MNKNASQSGQSLVELLCAIAVFTIGVTVIGYLILDAQVAERQQVEYTKAQLLAQECMEATRIIRDDSFEMLDASMQGIKRVQSSYELTPEPTNKGKFTRTLTIENIDVETKKITCAVHWNVTDARAGLITVSTLLTDWKRSNINEGIEQ